MLGRYGCLHVCMLCVHAQVSLCVCMVVCVCVCVCVCRMSTRRSSRLARSSSTKSVATPCGLSVYPCIDCMLCRFVLVWTGDRDDRVCVGYGVQHGLLPTAVGTLSRTPATRTRKDSRTNMPIPMHTHTHGGLLCVSRVVCVGVLREVHPRRARDGKQPRQTHRSKEGIEEWMAGWLDGS